jgi:fibronectin type 3 domain-containing protein
VSRLAIIMFILLGLLAACQANRPRPEAPSSLVAEGFDSTVDLSWTASGSEDVVGYRIYRSTSSNVTTNGTPLNASPVTETTYRDTTVTNGTTYYYVVVAVGANGTASNPSNTASATPQEGALAAPTGLQAAAYDGTVDLSWSPSPSQGVVGYNIYRSNSNNVPTDGTPVNASPVADTTYRDEGLTNGTTYYYVVTAVDAEDDESSPSNTASATPQADTPVPPLPPTGLHASAGDAKVDLSWTASNSAGVTGYNIYRDTQASMAAKARINTSPVTSTTYSDTSVTNGTTYYYAVTAVDGEGNESVLSTVKSAKPQAFEAGQLLGEIEVQFQVNASTQALSVQASSPSLSTQNTSVTLEPLTQGLVDKDGFRYLYGTFRVTNSTTEMLNNLSFYALSGTGASATLAGTPIRNLRNADGQALTGQQARSILPTHRMMDDRGQLVVKANEAHFQAFTPAEVAAVQAQVTSGKTVLEYGFVATGLDGKRPLSPGEQGVVSFAVKFPYNPENAASFPYSFTMVLAVVDEGVARVTRSAEEDAAGAADVCARAAGVNATSVVVLGTKPASAPCALTQLNDVRIATAAGDLPVLYLLERNAQLSKP